MYSIIFGLTLIAIVFVLIKYQGVIDEEFVSDIFISDVDRNQSLLDNKLASIAKFDPIAGDAISEFIMIVESNVPTAERNPVRANFNNVLNKMVDTALKSIYASDDLIVFFDKPNFNGRMYLLPVPTPNNNNILLTRKEFPAFFNQFLLYASRQFSYVLPSKYSVVFNSRISLIQTAADVQRDVLKPGRINSYKSINTPGVDSILVLLL